MSSNNCMMCCEPLPDKVLEKAFRGQDVMTVSCPHCGKLNVIKIEKLEKGEDGQT